MINHCLRLKIIFADEIEKRINVIDIYKLIAIYVDGSNLQIGARSMSIVTIQNYISMKTFLF